MMRNRRVLVAAIVVAALGFATVATAETFTLKVKRRDTGPRVFDEATYLYWQVQPQYFNMQMQLDSKGKVQSFMNQDQAFKRIVTKEPKYQSEHPFRGALKLGSQEYAFALDAVPEAEKKPEKENAEEKAKPAAKSGSILSALSAALMGAPAKPATPPMSLKGMTYNRLYFDANHNGDLTDDKVIEMPAGRNSNFASSPQMTYRPFDFPRIDVTIEVDDAKLDYSFFLQGYAYSSERNCQVSVQMMSAICREGDLTLEGKKHHVVLLDFNSNGRFDDEMKISPDIHLSGGQLYAQQGDVLLIDPQVRRGVYESPYDVTSSEIRHALTKTITIDGQLYDIKVSPAGDQLTLTKSTTPMGSVKNHNESFTAMIYGDKGFFKIRGTKDKPAAVPEGDWKLYSYTITCAPRPEPPKPAAKKEDKKAAKPAKQKGSLIDVLSAIVGAGEGPAAVNLVAGQALGNGPSTVSATATEGYKAVTVRAGETVELPFGPPYKPTVEAMNAGNPGGAGKQLYLRMTLVGSTGEAVSNMTVRGGRPGKPAFTITDPDGKVVQKGDFEYG